MLKPEGYKHTADIWEVLFQLKERNRPIAGQVGAIDYVNDEPVWVLAFPEFPGIKGYVPSRETGIDTRLISRFVGQEVMVQVKGLDHQNNLIACSRKELVALAEKTLSEELKIDDVIPVTIKAVLVDEKMQSRLVVDAGGGFLLEIPRSKAVKRLSVPLRQQYTVGQTVDARVIGRDPLEVSIRAAQPDPWTLVDYKRGQFISGSIYRVVSGTVFIEPDLSPGLLGLAPVPLEGSIKKGDRVSCKVYSFTAEKKKLHLSIIRLIK